MSRTKKLLSAALAATAVLSAGVAAGTRVSPLADAEAAIAISGTVTNNPQGYRVGNAPLYLWRHNGTSWVNLGRKGSSNASGAFTMYNIPDGYWYAVQGTATFGVCPAVRQTVYSRFSDSVWAGGVARTANVRMDFRGCAC